MYTSMIHLFTFTKFSCGISSLVYRASTNMFKASIYIYFTKQVFTCTYRASIPVFKAVQSHRLFTPNMQYVYTYTDSVFTFIKNTAQHFGVQSRSKKDLSMNKYLEAQHCIANTIIGVQLLFYRFFLIYLLFCNTKISAWSAKMSTFQASYFCLYYAQQTFNILLYILIIPCSMYTVQYSM